MNIQKRVMDQIINQNIISSQIVDVINPKEKSVK